MALPRTNLEKAAMRLKGVFCNGSYRLSQRSLWIPWAGASCSMLAPKLWLARS